VIRHVVLFSANPGKKDRLLIGLKKLEALVDEDLAEKLEVKKNLKLDTYSQECDVIVYGEFLSHDQLDKFKAHSIYQDCIKVVRPIRDLRIVADF
jgi:hypothetical protein